MHEELVIAKLATLAFGLLITYQAYMGYRRTGSRPLRYVAVGFLFISVGLVIEGLLYEFDLLSIYQASALQTTVAAIGMLFILYSLYGGSSYVDLPPPDEDERSRSKD